MKISILFILPPLLLPVALGGIPVFAQSLGAPMGMLNGVPEPPSGLEITSSSLKSQSSHPGLILDANSAVAHGNDLGSGGGKLVESVVNVPDRTLSNKSDGSTIWSDNRGTWKSDAAVGICMLQSKAGVNSDPCQ